MATNIEWTHGEGFTGETWSVTVGCSLKSDGCKHCYAMFMAARIANAAQAKLREGKTLSELEAAYLTVVRWERGGMQAADHNDKALPKWNGRVVPVESQLEVPLRWKKPRMTFVDSMSDLFHEDVPFEFIDKVFAVMRLSSRHVFQVLTKRAERMRGYFQQPAVDGMPVSNVWLGVSAENQQQANERIPHLLNCPAAVRFVSAEPLLGPIDFSRWFWPMCWHWKAGTEDPRRMTIAERAAAQARGDCWKKRQALVAAGSRFVDQVLFGIESKGTRVGRLGTFSSEAAFCEYVGGTAVPQCREAGVAAFVKQVPINGRVSHTPEDWDESLSFREFPQRAEQARG